MKPMYLLVSGPPCRRLEEREGSKDRRTDSDSAPAHSSDYSQRVVQIDAYNPGACMSDCRLADLGDASGV